MTGRDKKREMNVATVKSMFKDLAAKDVDTWISHWADEGARQLIPFSPEGFPGMVEGKETLRQIYRDLLAGYGTLRYTHIEIYPMEDPDTVVAEWGVDIEVRAGGRYENELIGIFRFKDGNVVELKEYFNPENFRKAIAK